MTLQISAVILIVIYCSDCLFFVWSLASAARHDNFGRAGLMALSFCIASASCHSSKQKPEYSTCMLFKDNFATPVDLLDALGIVIERSKQHFNPNYRLQGNVYMYAYACIP